MVCTGIDNASVVASVTIAQPSEMCYLKHCSSVGEVTCPEVSVSHSDPGAVGKVPVGWCMCVVTRPTMNVELTSSERVRIDCYSVTTIAIESKLSDQRVVTCVRIILYYMMSRCLHVSE